jgi:hypothetical protein
MNMAPVLLYFISKRRQEDIQVVDGVHADIMALEPEFRAFRESLVTVCGALAEALLKVGQGRLQNRIVDRHFGSGLVI